MRFACPSAAANKGRPLTDHETALRRFASELAQREGVELQPGLANVPPPLQGKQRVDWPDLLRILHALLKILRHPGEHMERRWRKCLALANLCRQSRLHQLQGGRLNEFLDILSASLEDSVPLDPRAVPAPGWVGRILFRQAAATFTRKDHGPDRGIARKGRLALVWAAWRFARGFGKVPRLHRKIPETTFEQIEGSSPALPPSADEILERYYTIKLESLQFCGATNFRLPFWEGLEMLAVTYPVIMWLTRALADLPPIEAIQRALTIVDDHFGYNRVLGSRRQRLSFTILARTGELSRLIAWYGR
jgi:lysine-N-methylase